MFNFPINSSYINYIIIGVSTLTLLGGMFCRKIFSSVRSIAISPMIGYLVAYYFLKDRPEHFIFAGTVISAILLVLSISFSLNHFYLKNVMSMMDSCFCLCIGLSYIFPNLAHKTLALGFAGLSVVLMILSRWIFDYVLIIETSFISTSLFLYLLRQHFGLSLIVYLVFVFLVSAVFILLSLIINGHKKNAKPKI